MDEHIVSYPCFMCGAQFQMGPGRYGKYIPLYKINVCSNCYGSNLAGWARSCDDERLVARLSDGGLPIPERNEEGLLPRE